MALAQPRPRPGRARSPRLGEQDGCVFGMGVMPSEEARAEAAT